MQEILVLIVIVLALFYGPRLFGRRPSPRPVVPSRPVLTGRIRLAIVITAFWPAGAAVLLQPWAQDPQPFFLLGLAPPLAFWGAVWIWFGYRRYRR